MAGGGAPEVDHFVVVTRDLAATVADIGTVVGVAPVPGGSHAHRGSRNYLLGLGGRRYLEIIAVDDAQQEPKVPRLFGLDGAFGRSRLATWGVRPLDFDEAVRAMAAGGHSPGMVSWLARPTAEGELRLRLTERPDVLEDGVAPFLVDWGDTPHPALPLPRVDLLTFRLFHPDPTGITDVLTRLGFDRANAPTVTWAVTPGLELVVQAADGNLVSLR
ncbi:uncharacterized protein PD653_4999 [Nocardioides sp. PD653]|nr:uncharacterized protein PD653B2_1933 [Nocardioides sp. PD653-B2]GAW57554.1 uncharacterized protein PD653_4999 [Nocardioides sp. PD653]